jgi:hypothetical protein
MEDSTLIGSQAGNGRRSSELLEPKRNKGARDEQASKVHRSGSRVLDYDDRVDLAIRLVFSLGDERARSRAAGSHRGDKHAMDLGPKGSGTNFNQGGAPRASATAIDGTFDCNEAITLTRLFG